MAKLEHQKRGTSNRRHPSSMRRIVDLHFPAANCDTLLSLLADYSPEELKFIPYKRYMCAAKLLEASEPNFARNLNSEITSYDTGCVIVHFGEGRTVEEYIKLATGLSHIISKPIAEPSGDYYGITTVKHTTDPPLKILDPYSVFSLHTDGVFMDNPVDWLMMMKIGEKNAMGGESRLLHIADFDEFEHFVEMPYSQTMFDFGLEQRDKRYEIFSKVSNMTKGRSKLLFETCGQRRVKFVDQFVIPKDVAEAEYIDKLQTSLESCTSVAEVTLPIGSAVILNNKFWIHGRAPFEKNQNLSRSLLRQYGFFEDQHPHGV